MVEAVLRVVPRHQLVGYRFARLEVGAVVLRLSGAGSHALVDDLGRFGLARHVARDLGPTGLVNVAGRGLDVDAGLLRGGLAALRELRGLGRPRTELLDDGAVEAVDGCQDAVDEPATTSPALGTHRGGRRHAEGADVLLRVDDADVRVRPDAAEQVARPASAAANAPLRAPTPRGALEPADHPARTTRGR